MALKEKIKNIPDSPGVYLFLNKAGVVIYIGKAASLKKRGRSYFNKTAPPYNKAFFINSIADIEYIKTPSEEEALLLEAAMVKAKQPKFNVMLKDDKSFPRLKLTLNEYFPRLVIVRRERPDRALYFGPYTNAKLLRKAVAVLRKIFPLRVCRVMPKSACLNYHIGQCAAPCIGKISRADYNRIVGDAILFLNAKKQELIEGLKRRMQEACGLKRFEEAAGLRDKIEALSSVGKAKRPALLTGNPPKRIEAFDISDISGKEAAGSMVSFLYSKPDKPNYRRFRIKFQKGPDDYKMMQEVIRRRYLRVIKERQPLPDWIIIDGGRGHVNAAKAVLDELGLGDILLFGIVKKEDNIYSPDKQRAIKLARDSKALRLIQAARDEAHRFAQSYHHLLRSRLVSGSCHKNN